MIYLLIAALFLAVVMIAGLVFLYLNMRNEYYKMRKLHEHYLNIYTGYRGAIEKELSFIRETRMSTTNILDKCIKITSDNTENTEKLVNNLISHTDAINDCYTKLEDRYSQLYDQYKDLKLEMKSRAHDILAAMPDNFNVPDEETLIDRLQYNPEYWGMIPDQHGGYSFSQKTLDIIKKRLDEAPADEDGFILEDFKTPFILFPAGIATRDEIWGYLNKTS